MILFAAALIVLCTACVSRSHSPPPPKAAPLSSDVRAAIHALEFPSRVLQDAESWLTADCMRAAGFSYPHSSGAGTTGQRSIFGLVGRLTPGEARNGGYRHELAELGAQANSPFAAYVANLPHHEKRMFLLTAAGPQSSYVAVTTLDGSSLSVPTKGCAGRARMRIYGSVENYALLARFPVVFLRFGNEISRQPSVQQALNSYSSCMSSSGYEVRGPGDAISLAESRFALNTRGGQGFASTRAERAMATTDAACQRSSGLFVTWDLAGFRLAAGWIREHVPEILRLAAVQAKAVRRANDILDRR